MLKYTVKRLAQSLVTILLIATIVFLLMRCLPTDYYFTEEQLMKFTEEQKYAALEVCPTPSAPSCCTSTTICSIWTSALPAASRMALPS